jgi:hypothetical protein
MSNRAFSKAPPPTMLGKTHLSLIAKADCAFQFEGYEITRVTGSVVPFAPTKSIGIRDKAASPVVKPNQFLVLFLRFDLRQSSEIFALHHGLGEPPGLGTALITEQPV